MYAAPGIGLAAPQIGVPLRVIVIDLSVGEDRAAADPAREPGVRRAGGRAAARGRLPVDPRLRRLAPCGRRASSCAGLDLDGKERVYEATELLARAFCHEIDHIDGLLFVDRLSPLKRDLMKRKLRKKRAGGAGRSRPVRVVFLGSGAFAVPSLEALLDAGHEVAGARDAARPREGPRAARSLASDGQARGRARAASPCCSFGASASPRRRRRCARLTPELQVVVAFGQILPRAVIDIAPRGTVNVHALAAPALARGGADPVGDRQRRDRDRRHHDADRRGPRHRPDRCCAATARDRPRGDGGRARAAAGAARRRAAGRDARAASRRARSRPCPRTTRRRRSRRILTKEDGRVDWTPPGAADRVPRAGLPPLARGLHASTRAGCSSCCACARSVAEPVGAAAPGTVVGGGRGRRPRRLRRGHAPAARRGAAREPARRCPRRPGRRRAAAARRAARLTMASPGPHACARRSCREVARGGVTLADALAAPEVERPRRARARARCTSSCSARCAAAAGSTTRSPASSSGRSRELDPASSRSCAWAPTSCSSCASPRTRRRLGVGRARARGRSAARRRLRQRGAAAAAARGPAARARRGGRPARLADDRGLAAALARRALARAARRRAARSRARAPLLEPPPTFVPPQPAREPTRPPRSRRPASRSSPGSSRTAAGARGRGSTGPPGRAGRRLRPGRGLAARRPGWPRPRASGSTPAPRPAARRSLMADLGGRAAAGRGGGGLARAGSRRSCGSPRAGARADCAPRRGRRARPSVPRRVRRRPARRAVQRPRHARPPSRHPLAARRCRRRAPRRASARAAREPGRLVRPGGQLVYATCSLEPEETREVVDAFLARDTRLRPGRAAAVGRAVRRRRAHRDRPGEARRRRLLRRTASEAGDAAPAMLRRIPPLARAE